MKLLIFVIFFFGYAPFIDVARAQDLWDSLGFYVTPNRTVIPPVDKSMLTDSLNLYSKVLGDLNGDGISDTVFMRPEFCPDLDGDEGFSYVFSDTTIPRIRTCRTYCISLDWLFSVGDLDEDGKIELGQYVNSCASRTKGILVLKLIDDKWKVIGEANYDVSFPEPDYRERVAKIGKGKFTIREIWYDYSWKKVDHELLFEIK